MESFDYEKEIEELKMRLQDIYRVNIEFEQDQNCLKSTYNNITIQLKKNYEVSDLLHELYHVKFLTQQGRILCPYPLLGDFNAEEYYLFTNILINLVYDIYVDVALYQEREEVPLTYFQKKRTIFKNFLKQPKWHDGMGAENCLILNHTIKEYYEVLIAICDRNTSVLEKYAQNSIDNQRAHIEKILNDSIYSKKFEWISYNTIYERESKK